MIQLHGILGRAKKVYGLRINAAAEVGKFPSRTSGEIQVLSPEEVWALVRAAGSEQDAAVFLTAAFTGLRMGELLAQLGRREHWTGDDDLMSPARPVAISTAPRSAAATSWRWRRLACAPFGSAAEPTAADRRLHLAREVTSPGRDVRSTPRCPCA